VFADKEKHYDRKGENMNDTMDEQVIDTMDEKMNNMLIDEGKRLSRDSIAAFICLEDEMYRIKTAIALIKSGKIVAIYNGDRSEPYDSNQFSLMTKREFDEDQNKDSQK
jgi:hypothetical protein